MTAPDADGWIEWCGGECPVDKDAHFDARYRDGVELYGCWPVDHDKLRAALWRHDGRFDDIVAYRVRP